MLDRYWHGGTSRISPEAPVPVVKIGQIEDRPGGAGNVALNIASLGAKALLVAPTGQDESAEILQSRLSAAGVACDFIHQSDQPTITKLRVISRHQQLIRLDFEEHYAELETAAMVAALERALPQCQAVILSDYAKGALADPQALINKCREHKIPVLVDPKGNDFSKYHGATLITPNLSEFEAVVGHCPNEKTLIEKGQALIKAHNWEALLITRGEHGMTLLRPNQQELHLPAKAQEVFDVTGAGDTVIGTLTAALAAGSSLDVAVSLANLAASKVVAKLGTAAISAPELRRAVQSDGESGYGVVHLDQLKIAIDDARAHGETLVFTNGCFDILHAGHVAYLRQAKALGSRLIVGVNSDASVQRLKGKGRPINGCERRMAVLAGLSAVDWVVEFTEDTPMNLIETLRPDVLVKGGDYAKNEIVGHELVESYGGRVEVLCFKDGLSTTAIIDNIQKQED